ncbi:hypothetical protein ACLVWU_14005 [Bdellovibrio sp. HCB290]|uniref:hypothetical protein n=1 Tax=Bdellovibrio sp. HCB290 TaxID=3394356 RepID=UPI0039B38652
MLNGPEIKGTYDGLVKGKGLMCFAGDAGTDNELVFVWQGYDLHLVVFAGETRLVKTTVNTLVSSEDVKLKRVFMDNYLAYVVESTPFNFELNNKYFKSELPIDHMTWDQKVANGKIFTVGINVNGRSITLPVFHCSKY